MGFIKVGQESSTPVEIYYGITAQVHRSCRSTVGS